MRSRCKYKVQRGTGQIIKAEECIINRWDELGVSSAGGSSRILTHKLGKGKFEFDVGSTILTNAIHLECLRQACRCIV